MGLADLVNTQAEKKNLGNTDTFVDYYSTGIDLLDYRLGSYDPELKKLNLGLPGGKLATFIGNSGTGKTTLALQATGSILQQFPDLKDMLVAHWDFETATSTRRATHLMGFSAKDLKTIYSRFDSNINSENFYKYVKLVAKVKKENLNDYRYDSGSKDPETGETIYGIKPSIILLDSIPSMFSGKISEEEEMGGQMDVAAQAKQNNRVTCSTEMALCA